MSFDVMEEARVEMSMFLERGPDLGISGLGQGATIWELQNNSGNIVSVPRFWQDMDVNFVPGAAAALELEAPTDGSTAVYTETVFDTELTMGAAALADFNLADFMSSVASTTGLSADEVVVIGVVVNITVEYAFD